MRRVIFTTMILLLIGPGSASADWHGGAQAALTRLDNLGDLGRGAAENAVRQVRQGAERVWPDARSNAIRLRGEAESTMADARQKWQEYQQRVARGTTRTSQAQVNLDSDFHEISLARSATAGYAYGIPGQSLAELERRRAAIASTLTALDRKYKVSATAQTVFTIDLARDFPEINALVTSPPCKPGDFSAALQAYETRVKEFLARLAQLDQKYQVSATLRPVTIDLAPLKQQLVSALQMSSCLEEAKLVGDAGERDAREILNFLTNLLGRTQAAAGTAAGRHATLGPQLGAEVRAVEALIAAVRELIAAEMAVRQAAKQIEDDKAEIGRSDDPAMQELSSWLSIVSIVDPTGTAAAGGDPTDSPKHVDKMGRDIDKLNKDYEAYRQAADRRNRALATTRDRLAAVGRQTSELARAIQSSGLRDATSLDSVVALATRFPTLQTPEASGQALISCVNKQLAAWGQANKAFDETAAKIRAAVKQKLQAVARTIPQDVKTQLAATLRAGMELQASIAQSETAAKAAVTAWAAYAAAVGDLGTTVVNVAATPVQRTEKISVASTRSNELAEREQAAREAFNKTRVEAGQFTTEVGKLDAVIQRHAKEVAADLAGLVRAGMKIADLSPVEASAVAFIQCATQKKPLMEAALRSLGNRAAQFAQRRAQAVAGLVPPAVVQSVERCMTMATDLATTSAALAGAVGQAQQRGQEYMTAYGELMASVIPVPQPNAAQRLQTTQSRLTALQQAANAVGSRVNAAASGQAGLGNCVFLLRTSVLEPVAGLREDARSVVFQAVDLDPGMMNQAAQEAQRIGTLIGLWTTAGTSLPQRLSAFAAKTVTTTVAGTVNPVLKSGVEAALNDVQTRVNDCVTCLNRAASTAQRLLNDAGLIATAAVNETIDRLRGSVDGAAAELRSQIPPPVGSRSLRREKTCRGLDPRDLQGRCWELNTPDGNAVRNVIDAANRVANDVDGAADSARTTFESRIGGLRNDVQKDINCIAREAANARAKADEARAMLVSTTSTQPAQMQRAPAGPAPLQAPAPRTPAPRPFGR